MYVCFGTQRQCLVRTGAKGCNCELAQVADIDVSNCLRSKFQPFNIVLSMT